METQSPGVERRRCSRAFWPALLVGVSGALLVVELRPVRPGVPAPDPDPSWGLEADPFLRSPRELRMLPGIGVERANRVAEERWMRAGEPFAWSDVEGIGPATEARVRTALEAEGRGAAGHLGGPRNAGSPGQPGPHP